VRHVAELLDCHVNTVMTYIAEGKLEGHNPNGPGVKGLRVTVESLKKYERKYLLKKLDLAKFKKEIEDITKEPKKKRQRRNKGFALNY